MSPIAAKEALLLMGVQYATKNKAGSKTSHCVDFSTVLAEAAKLMQVFFLIADLNGVKSAVVHRLVSRLE